MLESWTQHFSPDTRPSDKKMLASHLAAAGMRGDESMGFLASPRGPVFPIYHFWLYSLCAVPARVFLGLMGWSPLGALPATNAALLCGALFVVLFEWQAPLANRLAIAALSTCSPVVLYLRWMSHEVFTFSCVLVALVAIDYRRHGWAAAIAACGAMQNPPVGAVVLLALGSALLERDRSHVVAALSGSLLALVPPAFYAFYFGVPSLVVSNGLAKLENVSLGRTWSLLFDLNQGLLPYVPGTLGLAAFGVCRAVRRRDLGTLARASVAVATMLGVQTSVNWNSPSAGLMRYATWQLPLLSWLAVSRLPRTRTAASAVAFAGLLQCGIAVAQSGARDDAYLRFTPLAELVLCHAPRLYDPEPEIFVERQLHGDWIMRQASSFPVVFSTRGGEVTKILASERTVSEIPSVLQCEASWVARISPRRRPGPFYLTPPRGAARTLPAPTGPAVQRALTMRVVRVSQPPRRRGVIYVSVAVGNRGPRVLWGAMSRDRLLGIVPSLGSADGARRGAGPLTPLPLLHPGAEAVVVVPVTVKWATARYSCHIQPAFQGAPPMAPLVSLVVDVAAGKLDASIGAPYTASH